MFSNESVLRDASKVVGEIARLWGIKKISGKIWFEVFLSEDPLDASDISKRLKISKALTSITLNELVSMRAIVCNGKGRRGTRTYKSNSDLAQVLFQRLNDCELPLMEALFNMLTVIDTLEPSTIVGSNQSIKANLIRLRTIVKDTYLILQAVAVRGRIDEKIWDKLLISFLSHLAPDRKLDAFK